MHTEKNDTVAHYFSVYCVCFRNQKAMWFVYSSCLCSSRVLQITGGADVLQ